jgi:tetratricopeptide (TPR) repeat protein
MSTIDTVSIDRVRRKRLIREAEGYLDLMMVFEDRWPLDLALKKQIADRMLVCLAKIKKPLGHKPYVLFLKGQACLACNRFKQAIHHLRLSAKLDGENIHTLIALAWCYKRTDQLDLAIATLEEALVLDSQSAIAHYNLACYFALQKNTPSAVMHLTMAIDLNSDYRKHVAKESDFDPIRHDPGFVAATSLIV